MAFYKAKYQALQFTQYEEATFLQRLFKQLHAETQVERLLLTLARTWCMTRALQTMPRTQMTALGTRTRQSSSRQDWALLCCRDNRTWFRSLTTVSYFTPAKTIKLRV